MKVIKKIAAFSEKVNPIFGLASAVVGLYLGVKALKSTQPTQKESFEAQAKFSEEKRKEAEQDNRIKRSYNHLGFKIGAES
jgi:L-lactate permease